ncbi:DUF2812 domain-containing protein [Tissierellaceae bacterium HCP3S3_D8]
MSDMIRKILVGDLSYIQEYEEYFSEMSRKGLHLQKVGSIFAYFKEGQSKSLNYRIDVVNDDRQEKVIEKHKEKGWNFVGKRDSFLIFSSQGDSQLKELYETPEAQKLALSTANKEIFSRGFLHIVGIIDTIVIVILSAIIPARNSFYLALARGNGFYAFIPPFFSFYRFKKEKRRLRKIEEILDNGEFLRHQGDYSLMKMKFIIRKLALTLFMVSIIGIMSYKISQDKRISLSEIDDLESLPVITIADIETKDCIGNSRKSFYKDDDIDYGNIIYQHWNLLMPKENTLIESVRLADRSQNGTEITPRLIVEYYLTRFDFIARGLEQDILRENKWYSLEPYAIEREDKFSCYVVNKEDEKIILYRKGKQVIFLTYSNGTVSLEELVKVIVEKLDQYST